MRRPLILLTASLAALPALGLTAEAAPRRSAAAKPRKAVVRAPRIRSAPAQPTMLPARTAVVTGRVLLPDGEPAAGATLWISSPMSSRHDAQEVRADAQGRFQHVVKYLKMTGDGRKQPIAVSAFAAGRGFEYTRLTFENAPLPELAIRLQPLSSLRGRLVGLDGKPLAGTRIRLAALTPAERPIFDQSEMHLAILRGMPLIPPEHPSGQFKATTGEDGLFRLEGLPRMGEATLVLEGDKQILTPGSSAAIRLRPAAEQNAGVLSAFRPAKIRVRVRHLQTGKPVVGLMAQVVTADIRQLGYPFGVSGAGGGTTDARGYATSEGLAPGKYRVVVDGALQEVTVREGETAGPLEFRTRRDHVKGRLLDPQGKPIPHASISLHTSEDSLPVQVSQFGGRQLVTAGQTDRYGRFTLPNIPWGAPEITIRSTRGNAVAEWKGSGKNLPLNLVLRARPNVLTSARGRLVDATRKPLAKAAFNVVRWQDTPRFTWFNETQTGITDAKGWFKVDGIARGEAFSLIGGGPFGQLSDETASFETPRFTTGSAGNIEELGEIVVHPLEGPQQIVQLYGFEGREQLIRLTGFVPPPSPAELPRLRETLRRYNQALAIGDLPAAKSCLSQASPGWSDSLPELLSRSSLRPIGDAEVLAPVRFMPQFAPTYLLTLTGEGGAFGFDFGAGARAFLKNPEWVFLHEPHSPQEIAAVLRRENGEWKIVLLPPDPGFASLFLAAELPGGLSAPNPPRTAVPALVQPDAALAAAGRYLDAWRRSDTQAQLGLTSRFSPLGGTPEEFRKRWARRADQGEYPLADGTADNPALIEGLSAWELERLAVYPTFIRAITGEDSLGPAFNPDAQSRQGFPRRYAERGEIAIVKYRAAEDERLMILVRESGAWKVLEPALPTGSD